MTTVEEYAAQTRIAGFAGSRSPRSVHTDSRGRRTLDEFLSIMAWHDDNHLAQLVRALAGRP